jgi:ribosomal protein S18 acetylase RimI-like enzyme
MGSFKVRPAFSSKTEAGKPRVSLLTSHGFRPVRQAWVMKCDRAPEVPELPGGIAVDVAQLDDAPEILDLYLESGFEGRAGDAMRTLLDDGRHAHAVARQGDEMVAFVELETHWPKRPWVSFVGVAKPLRDQGLGSLLVAFALERQFEAGAQAGLLALSPANRTALRAYEKVGFRRFRLIDALEKQL